MAIPKSEAQKAINKILKLHCKGFPAFTELEFREEDSVAYELEQLYNKKSDATLEAKDRYKAARSFQYLVYKTTVTSNKCDQERDRAFPESVAFARKSVAAIFGLQNEPLIDQLVCAEYVDDYRSDLYLESEIYAKVSAWVNCCQFVDTMITYLKKKYPKWSSMSKEEKRNISVYDLIKETPFQNNISQLQYVVDFLDNDYGLNQKTLAKAHCLLSLELPKIDTIAIAKSIEKYSSLTKKK